MLLKFGEPCSKPVESSVSNSLFFGSGFGKFSYFQESLLSPHPVRD